MLSGSLPRPLRGPGGQEGTGAARDACCARRDGTRHAGACLRARGGRVCAPPRDRKPGPRHDGVSPPPQQQPESLEEMVLSRQQESAGTPPALCGTGPSRSSRCLHSITIDDAPPPSPPAAQIVRDAARRCCVRAPRPAGQLRRCARSRACRIAFALPRAYNEARSLRDRDR